MGTTTQIVVLPEKDLPLEVQEVKLPDPTAHQVEIRQFASGICHSQLHVMQRPRSGPTILGHESTGVVTRVGSAVADIKEGDRVMASWVPRRRRRAGYGISPTSARLTARSQRHKACSPGLTTRSPTRLTSPPCRSGRPRTSPPSSAAP